MAAGLVFRVTAIVFAVPAVFSTTILAVQMLFAPGNGSMPSKLAWVPWMTILTGIATATLVMQMLPVN